MVTKPAVTQDENKQFDFPVIFFFFIFASPNSIGYTTIWLERTCCLTGKLKWEIYIGEQAKKWKSVGGWSEKHVKTDTFYRISFKDF